MVNKCNNPKCNKPIGEKGWCSDECRKNNIGDIFPDASNAEEAKNG